MSRFRRRGEVFLMNTLTDAQLIVSQDIAGLLDRLSDNPASLAPERLDDDDREALVTLTEHGFIVPSRASDTEGARTSSSRTIAKTPSSCASPC